MAVEITRKIRLDNPEHISDIFGSMDENLKIIEDAYDVKMTSRESHIIIKGIENDVKNAELTLIEMVKSILAGEPLDKQKIDYFIDSVSCGKQEELEVLRDTVVCVTARGKYIKPKTKGQEIYISSIKSKDVVFGVGPAGTGKTYLAVAMAVKALKSHEVNRIIITRPAVEAGENLGFLPGDLQSKVDPYLRPIYDALFDILGAEKYESYMEKGFIEIAPLAYMRGRTLDNSFIILDEAQNTTVAQMKMFLTRFGFGSKVVLNGDVTQVDLPRGKESGLRNAIEVLKNVDEIGICYFSPEDVVRHRLVRKIITEYDKYEKKEKTADKYVKKSSRGQ